MNIIIEGVDATYKSTEIQFIKNELEKRGKIVYIIHCSNFKFSDDLKEIESFSKKYYKDLLLLMRHSSEDKDHVIIFDRAHLGEYVYSPIYRNYDGSYVFDYEKEILLDDYSTKLIVFSDDPQKIIERDKKRNDKLSFSLALDKKTEEVNRFVEAFNKSVLNKKFIELKDRSSEQVWKEDVLPFIGAE